MEERDEWAEEDASPGLAHADWVRDVAWAPSLGSAESLIASCSQARLPLSTPPPPSFFRLPRSPHVDHAPPTVSPQDKKVIIWTQKAASTGKESWERKEIQFSCVVWRVSWSVTGNILAVSGGDNQVTLWKESLLGEWTQIGQLSEDGSAAKS